MEWSQYERLIMKDWDDLLNGTPPPNEAQVQVFFEQHPSIVPGAFSIIGGESGHAPWLSSLISQPILPSYEYRKPDFMWISTCSDMDEPVLIEIEAPSKRWFTKARKPTSHLTEALNQIAEWKAWFNVPHNVAAFKTFYGLDRHAWYQRRFRPSFLLIYGRRAEANSDPRLTQKRSYLHSDDIVIMTYDRLSPNFKAFDLICVKPDGAGRFKAISVPPTFTWSPWNAEDHTNIIDLDAAIKASPLIPPARKEFLIRRIPYWREWVLHGKRGSIKMGDKE